MRHLPFIASYAKDFEWLTHCLASLQKHAVGFEPPAVCVDSSDLDDATDICRQYGANVVVKDGEGFMRAQIAMMEADLLCPEADVIYLIGSDCIALPGFTPDIYCKDGKPVVLMNSYFALAEARSPCMCWLRGTERVLGFAPEYEYMRRLPSVFPASIFAPMRAHVERLHDLPFGEYIIHGNKPRRDTSEANILGAYAHVHMPDSCHFHDVDNVEWHEGNPVGYPSALGQFWSHGGLDRPGDSSFFYEANGQRVCAAGRPPRQVLDDLGL